MPKGKRLTKNKGMIGERITEAQQMEYKSQILSILDNSEAKTLSGAARMVGISPSKVRDWTRSDENFRNQVKQAQKVLADRLIEELLDDQFAKMPQIVAKIFIIKGLAPEFRDSYKVVEFRDKRGVEILEELRRLGKQHTEKVSKLPEQLPPAPQPENPLVGTVERINYANKGTD